MNMRRLFLLAAAALVAVVPAMAQDATEEAAEMEYAVNVSSSDTLGNFLVDGKGMTLYTFDKDVVNKSNCSGKCLEAWPAFTVESADALTADESIPGTWGTITREDDGALQVTYNGLPLYYWANDVEPGDTTGQAVGKVWWVAEPATVSVAATENGQFLVGDKGMTLYLFANDEEGVSNCTDQCLANWPAFTVEDADSLTAGAHVAGTLGTITREDDGTLQVTYNGWPLYYWAKDAAIGDTTGQGVGDVWWVVVPETVVVSEEGTLTDNNGFTLYTFAKDTADSGTSACTGDCSKNWPALTVPYAEALSAGVGVTGELGTIDLGEGKLQVTYNGWPLYYFAQDLAAGEANGVSETWPAALP